VQNMTKDTYLWSKTLFERSHVSITFWNYKKTWNLRISTNI